MAVVAVAVGASIGLGVGAAITGGFAYKFYRNNSKGEKDAEWTKLREHLGNGQIGSVFVWKYKDGTRHAVKEVVKADQERTLLLRNEAAMLAEIKHKNIVHYELIRESEIKIYLHMEVMECSVASLAQKSPIEEDRARSLTRDILDGLVYLHSKNIIHKDIKGENVLIDKDGTAKLCDFGLAKYFEGMNASHTKTSIGGTCWFLAPEFCLYSTHGRRSDVWAVACTTYQMLKQKPPMYELGLSLVAIGNKISNMEHRSAVQKSDLSPSIKSFLLEAFVDKDDRPYAEDLRKHHWIAEQTN